MDYAKLAPSLRVAYHEYVETGAESLIGRSGPLGLVSLDEPAKTARALIFVECEPDAPFERLRDEHDVVINEGGTDIRTGIAPIGSLPAIAEYPGVEYVSSSPLLRSYVDVACRKIGLEALKGRYVNPGLDGTDVVVGIVDSGIDPTHPAFFGRIKSLWDQTLGGGGGVPEGRYGTELTDHGIQLSHDRVGHGTHVAGIAAGAGLYPGVAPAAHLIVVKTHSPAPSIHVLDAVRYIFRCAEQLGLPAVINLSLGHHHGPHDGTDQLSRGVDQATGPGRIVCCAAGNEGMDNIHAGTVVGSGILNEMFFLPAPGTTRLSGWHSGNDDIGISVVSPSGYATGVNYDHNSEESCQFPDGWVSIATSHVRRNNSRNFDIVVRSDGEHRMATSAAWRICLLGRSVRDGRVDVWISDSPEPGSQFTGAAASSSMTIAQPADATSAIAVAAYTTRVTWVDSTAQGHTVGFKLDDICDFSSEGPRRDNVEKPDLAAPGAVVTSCLSRSARVDADWVVDHERCAMFGTSMAAPFVTGTVALLLQRDPGLDPARVVGMLQARSVVPGQPAGTYDPKWGYGLVELSRI